MTRQWPLAKSFPTGDRGIVAAKHPLAAEAGVWALRQGGTAVDAAVAASFAAGVVEPYMSGVGGGGLAVYRPAGSNPIALHFGMRAPASARESMYQIIPGSYDTDLFGWPRTERNENISGPRSMATPGLVGGLHRLWTEGGHLPWKMLLQPAIDLAEKGFEVDWITSLKVLDGFDLLTRFPTSRNTFLARGRPPKPDLGVGAERLTQPDIAATLNTLAAQPDSMESGDIAQSIANASEGRIQSRDIAGNALRVGAPLTIGFGDLHVHAVPWATGGPTVIEWLGILQHLDPPRDENDPRLWWAILKAGDIALADRFERLGDPDFSEFPDEVLRDAYHFDAADAIRTGHATYSRPASSSGSTTHISTVDAAGNSVSLTQTLLSLWGSGVVTPETGICMNNGMMWFDPEPGRVNSIAPGKQPLANMCPVLITRNREPLMVYGASGGRRIMPAVVQILVRVAWLGQSLREAMNAPRIDLSAAAIRVDSRFGSEFCKRLSTLMKRPVSSLEAALGASHWASPVGLMRLDDGQWTGAADQYTMATVLAM